MPPGKSVVAGHAAFRYSWMRPSHGLVRTTVPIAGGASGGSWAGFGVSGAGTGEVKLVVVLDIVADQALELAPVPDDRPVSRRIEPIQRSAKVLATGVRDGCAGNLEAFGSEDLVERVNELAPVMADQCSSTAETLTCGAVAGSGRLGWSKRRSGWRWRRRRITGR